MEPTALFLSSQSGTFDHLAVNREQGDQMGWYKNGQRFTKKAQITK